jgi:hypothetical protein
MPSDDPEVYPEQEIEEGGAAPAALKGRAGAAAGGMTGGYTGGQRRMRATSPAA